MLIRCPQCDKQYKLPDDKVKAGGVKVKCKACETVFTVAADGSTAASGAAPAAKKDAAGGYLLYGPEGEELGPFPLDTVRARIEVGEVSRDWRIAPEGGAPVPIVDFAALDDVTWPEGAAGDDFGDFDDFGGDAPTETPSAAGGDDDFGFDEFASGSASSADGASAGDDFGFDDFEGGASGPASEAAGADDGFGDLGDLGGDAPAPSAPAAGGGAAADFGFDDDFAEPPADAPAASAPGGDDFGDFDDFGGDAPAPSAPAASGGDDDFGFDDDFAEPPADAPAATASSGDDFGDFGDFGGDAPAPSAPAASGGDDDFGFDDDFAEPPADAPAASAPGGDDFGDFDDFGGDAAADAPAPTALDALFDEGGDAAGEIDESAFGFDDAAGKSAGEDVFYEEDFDGTLDEEVARGIAEGAASEAADAEGADDIFADAPAAAVGAGDAEDDDDELITTLEQLSQSRKRKSSVPVLPVLGGLLGLVLLLGGLIYLLPGTMRGLPLVGGLTLDIHRSLGTAFHTETVRSERWAQAGEAIRDWTPERVRAGFPPLEEVLRVAPPLDAAIELGAQAWFFLGALAVADPASAGRTVRPGLPAGDPRVALTAWALGVADEAPSVDTTSSAWRLASAWRAFHDGDADAALAQLSEPRPGLVMPWRLFDPLARARVATTLGDHRSAVAAWQQAVEAQPDNPWLNLNLAWAIWKDEPRATEIREALEAGRAHFGRLGRDEQLRHHELNVRVALWEDRVDEARRAAEVGLRLQGNHVTLLALRGQALVLQKAWADANLVLDQALQIDPRHPEALVQKSAALAGIGRVAEGIDLLADAIRTQPAQPLLQTRYLQMLLDQNRLADAEQAYLKAVEQLPDQAEIVMIGADLALARNDVEMAEQRLDAFSRRYPNDPQVLLKLAEIALRRGQLARAEGRLRAMVEADSRNVAARVQLGELLIGRGKAAEAQKILFDARDLHPDNPRIYNLLARSYLDGKKPQEALEMLAESVRINSSVWRTHLLTGEAYLVQGRHADAILSLERAASLSEDAPEVLLWLARVHREQNRPGRAMEYYRAVLEKEPENRTALAALTVGEMSVDNWRQAVELARTWRRLAPAAPEPYLYEGRALTLLGDAKGAIEVLSTGLRRNDGSAALHSEKGWAHLQLEQMRDAQTHLARAQRIAPRDGLNQLRIGYLYKAQGRIPQARQAFEAALRSGLTPEDAARARSELQILKY